MQHRPNKAALLVSLLLATQGATAAITGVTISPAQPVEGSSIAAVVSFDRRLCGDHSLPVGEALTKAQRQITQARVVGNDISISVAATYMDTGFPTCVDIGTQLTIELPPLPAGSYSVRVGEGTFAFAIDPLLFGNRTIKSVASATFNVTNTLPASVPVYQEGGYLRLSSVDGFYQAAPDIATEATSVGRWLPAFYAWRPSSAAANPSALAPVYELFIARGQWAGKPFYTMDSEERASLLASGFFKNSSDNQADPNIIFSAIKPAGGLCPRGRVGIYRAFDVSAMRYSFLPENSYRALVANGWRGEGVVFCAALEPPENGWAPN